MKKICFFAVMAVVALFSACSSDSGMDDTTPAPKPVVKLPETKVEVGGVALSTKATVFNVLEDENGDIDISSLKEDSWHMKTANNCNVYFYNGSYNPNPNNSHVEKEPCRQEAADSIDNEEWHTWAEPNTVIAYASYNSQQEGNGQAKDGEILQPNNAAIYTKGTENVNVNTASSAFCYEFTGEATQDWYIKGKVEGNQDKDMILTRYKLYTCKCGVCKYIGFDIDGNGSIDWINICIAEDILPTTPVNPTPDDTTPDNPTPDDPTPDDQTPIVTPGDIEVDIHQQEHSDWSSIKTTIHVRDVVDKIEVNVPLSTDVIAEQDDFAIRTYEGYIELEGQSYLLNFNISHVNGVTITVGIPYETQVALAEYLETHPDGVTIEVWSYVVGRAVNSEKTWEEIQNSTVKVDGDTTWSAHISSAFFDEKKELSGKGTTNSAE